MRLTVNGQDLELDAPCAVGALVAHHTGTSERRGLAVAVNGAVVPRSAWDDVVVAEGDEVEIAAPLQGG